ncbi:MAG: hypothetical protein ACRDTS_00950 [Mycobacterium sp.]
MSAIQLDEAKRKMSAIRDSLGREVDQIRNNPKYSDSGRAQELAKSLLAHRNQADLLRTNFSVNNEDVRLKLTAKLFGIPNRADPATILVYRDAEDRAAKLTNPDDAAAMLARATEKGDTLLARAVAGHAHSKKWQNVTESYAEAAGLADGLDELNALPSGAMLKTAVTALFSLPTPPELRTLIGDTSDGRLQRIADGEGLQPSAPIGSSTVTTFG